MQSRVVSSPFFNSLLIIVPFFAAVLLTETPYFETNDDAWLMLTLSGQVTSPAPTGWVYFLHPLLSHALANLYRVTGSIPWYGVMHIASLFLAFWAILYALLLQGCSWQKLLVFSVCLVAFGLPAVIALQFTKTAFLAGLAGIFLCTVTLAQSFSRPVALPLTVLRLSGGFLLLLLSLMIRRESLYLVCLLSVPLLLFLAWSAKKSQLLRFFLTICLLFSFLLAAVGAAHRYAYARSPEWRRFEQLLLVKSVFIDFKRVAYNAQTEEYFRAVGWSENDYHCLQNWFYVDPKIYSLENLQSVAAHFPATARSRAEILQPLQAHLSHLRTNKLLWFVVPFCLSSMLVAGHCRLFTLTLIAIGIETILVAASLAVFFHLPDRVSYPLLTAICWFTLLFWNEEHSPQLRSSWSHHYQSLGLLCLAGTALFLFPDSQVPLARAVAISREFVTHNANLRAALQQLQPQRSQTFVVWGAAFPYEFILPLERQGYLQNFRILGLGATNQSPLQRRMLEVQGIDDLHRALFERQDVFLTLSPQEQHDQLLINYLSEHYGVAASVTSYWQHAPLHVWKVTRANNAAGGVK
jgi:hypothetical protein